MKKSTMSTIKLSSIGIVGTIASVAISLKVGDMVYEASENFDVASLAAGATAVAGIGATAAAVIVVADHDVDSWSAQDLADSHRLSTNLRSITTGMDMVAKSLRIASFLTR